MVKTSLPRDTDDPSFEKNHAIIEGMDINIKLTMDENLHKINKRFGPETAHDDG